MSKKTFEIKITYTMNCETEKAGKEKIKKIFDEIVIFEDYIIKAVRDRRSMRQNSAIHKYFQMISDHCFERGLTVGEMVKEPHEVTITPEFVKDRFRDVGKSMFGASSTADLDKKQMKEVIDVFERVVSERIDFQEPFPSIESMFDV